MLFLPFLGRRGNLRHGSQTAVRVWIVGQRIAHWMPGQQLPAHMPVERVELDVAELEEQLRGV